MHTIPVFGLWAVVGTPAALTDIVAPLRDAQTTIESLKEIVQ